jgi:hypothetical protein
LRGEGELPGRLGRNVAAALQVFHLLPILRASSCRIARRVFVIAFEVAQVLFLSRKPILKSITTRTRKPELDPTYPHALLQHLFKTALPRSCWTDALKDYYKDLRTWQTLESEEKVDLTAQLLELTEDMSTPKRYPNRHRLSPILLDSQMCTCTAGLKILQPPQPHLQRVSLPNLDTSSTLSSHRRCSGTVSLGLVYRARVPTQGGMF